MADAQEKVKSDQTAEPAEPAEPTLYIKAISLDDSPQNVVVQVEPTEAPDGSAAEAVGSLTSALVTVKAPKARVLPVSGTSDSPQVPTSTLALENVNEFLEYREVDQMVNDAYYYK